MKHDEEAKKKADDAKKELEKETELFPVISAPWT